MYYKGLIRLDDTIVWVFQHWLSHTAEAHEEGRQQSQLGLEAWRIAGDRGLRSTLEGPNALATQQTNLPEEKASGQKQFPSSTSFDKGLPTSNNRTKKAPHRNA